LLASHEKVEDEVKVYSKEIDRLKSLSSKVIQGTSSARFDRLVTPEEEWEQQEIEVC